MRQQTEKKRLANGAEASNSLRPIDPVRLLTEIAERWRSGDTLEYRSHITLNHVGELHLDARIHAHFRRPNKARLVLMTNSAEWSRVIVSDGRQIFDRSQGTRLRPARTTQFAVKQRLLQDIPHPLDETGYFVEQFFSPTPFVPQRDWGQGNGQYDVSAIRFTGNDPKRGRQVRTRLTFTSEKFRDTITLDGITLEPVEIVRVGEHAGQVQELLRERFEVFRLAPILPMSLFTWTPADEAGRTLRL